MAVDEVSQTGLVAGDAMVWCVRGLNQCNQAGVLRAAAHAIAAIAYNSTANKAQFAQLGALAACVRVVSNFGNGSIEHTEHYVAAVLVLPHASAVVFLGVAILSLRLHL